MIYVDTAYLIKCFVPEPGHAEVRELLAIHKTLAICAFGYVEFAAAARRATREGRIPPSAVDTVFQCLAEDEHSGMWSWLPITTPLLQAVTLGIRRLPANVYIRAGNALHLVCARENGFREIYSNDRHLLAATPHFGLRGINVIP